MEHAAVDWSILGACYGPADNIPEMLGNLADPRRCTEAVSSLWGNLCHQGTVYEASAAAVPFLFRAAINPALSDADRAQLFALIVHIGLGEDTCWRGYTSWAVVQQCSDAVATFVVPMLERAFEGDEAARPWAVALAAYFPSVARTMNRDIAGLVQSSPAALLMRRIVEGALPTSEDVKPVLDASEDLRDYYDEVLNDLEPARQARCLIVECAVADRL